MLMDLFRPLSLGLALKRTLITVSTPSLSHSLTVLVLDIVQASHSTFPYSLAPDSKTWGPLDFTPAGAVLAEPPSCELPQDLLGEEVP